MSKKIVKFKRLSYNAYRLTNPINPDTIYFILDQPFIFMNNIQYGLTLDSSKHLIKSLSFDNATNELKYTVSGDNTVYRVPIDILNATTSNNGLMTKEHVQQLDNAVTSIGDIADIEVFVQTEIENSSPNIEWVDVSK